jgi:hypothetical protein
MDYLRLNPQLYLNLDAVETIKVLGSGVAVTFQGGRTEFYMGEQAEVIKDHLGASFADPLAVEEDY